MSNEKSISANDIMEQLGLLMGAIEDVSSKMATKEDMARVEARVDRIEAKVGEIEGKVEQIEGKVDNIARDAAEQTYALVAKDFEHRFADHLEHLSDRAGTKAASLLQSKLDNHTTILESHEERLRALENPA